MYSIQDILNPEKDISSFYFYGDSQTEKTSDSYTTVWDPKKVALQQQHQLNSFFHLLRWRSAMDLDKT